MQSDTPDEVSLISEGITQLTELFTICVPQPHSHIQAQILVET